MQLERASQVFSSVSWFDEIDSTNLELSRALKQNPQHFMAVIAGSQSAGQGRMGRQWQSPPGSSLSLSVAITTPISHPGWLSLLAAMAVQRMLVKHGLAAGIKWPNDVHVDGKKICGILATLESPSIAIVGIGLNLKPQSEELAAIALSELGVEMQIDSAAAEIGLELRGLLDGFRENPLATRAEYAANSLTLGNQVRAELPDGKQLIGLASEIAPGGELVILTPEPRQLSAGDVWHLRG